MSSLAIEIQNLSKIYQESWWRKGSKYAVQDFTLQIEKGEIWALAGPNGAGKSTTLHCLAGLLHPTTGTIRVFGLDPILPEARSRMGFQSEIFFSYPFRSARGAMELYGKLSGLKGAQLASKVEAALASVGLSEVAQQRLGTFSKGMMQRFGLGQSLLHDPDVVVWDEPSTGLDPEGRKLVMDILRDLKAKGKSVLLSTHILSDVEKICDHVAVMQKGKVVLSGGIEELLSKVPGQTLEDLYLSAVREVDHVA